MKYSKDYAEQIIDLIKKVVETEGNCRVGWACNEVLKENQYNHVHDKVSALIILDTRYIRERNERFKEDWNILRNPNYKEEKPERWHQKNPVLYDFIKIGSAALVGGIVGYLLKK